MILCDNVCITSTICDCHILKNLSVVGMKCRAGYLNVACVWMVVLTQSLDARHAPKKHVAGVSSCMPKQLTALTKRLVEESLASFDEANGRHLGTWSPGFPELQVHQNSAVSGPTVQCSLSFMAHGLEKVLEDQRSNLNPQDAFLHNKLGETVSRVNMLAVCVKAVLGGECTPKPPPPTMPKHAFDRKQWSHTLLKRARAYLDWLEHNIGLNGLHTSKVTGGHRKRLQRYSEGSGYLL